MLVEAKKMKYQLSLIVLVLFVFLMTPLASAELITQGSSVHATLLKYQPVPAKPGDLVEVWIQVENSGGSASKGGALTLIDSYPFLIESATDRVKEFPSIPPQSSFLIQTRVRVDKNANEGDNAIVTHLQLQGSGTWIEDRLSIPIQGDTSALSVERVTTTPDRIAPGGEATISLMVKNVGLTRLRNVKTTLDFSGTSLIPLGGTNSQTASELRAGQEREFVFTVLATPEATSSAVSVPLTLAYDNEEGTAQTQTEAIGTLIGSEPELLIYLERITLYKETGQGGVMIKFVNKGLGEIKLLEMTIPENDEVAVVSESNTVYVGNIDADDYESADVTLRAKKDGGQLSLPVKVTYRDALNVPYEETVTLTMNLPSKNGKSGVSWPFFIVVIIIVAGIGYFIYRRRCAAHQKKK